MPLTCCGTTGTPFVQTTFLGASIARFSAQTDWNGAGGGLQVELVEDICSNTEDPYVNEEFHPPRVGTPVWFAYGAFTYGGILQNWKQHDSATGAKNYTVNVVSPREIVDGTQVILSSYNGPVAGIPNIANVYGWLEENSLEGVEGATITTCEPDYIECQGRVEAAPDNECGESGYAEQGSVASFEDMTLPTLSSDLNYTPAPGYGLLFNQEIGMPWYLIQKALCSILNDRGDGLYGRIITFRGHQYFMDLSELPWLGGDIRIPGENMTLEDLIAHVCTLGGVDYFYELITPGTECDGHNLDDIINIIKVRTSDNTVDNSAKLVDDYCASTIDARLAVGTIGQMINSNSCLTRYSQGLELRMDVSNALLTGEFRQEIWQTEYDDDVWLSPHCRPEDANCTRYDDFPEYQPYDCQGQGTIWPYWGKDYNSGDIIIGKECLNTTLPAIDDLKHGHHFVIKTDHLEIGIAEWDITMFELQAALVGQGNWETWLSNYEPQKYSQIMGVSENYVPVDGAIYDRLTTIMQECIKTKAENDPANEGPSADKMFLKHPDFISLGIDNIKDISAPDKKRVYDNGRLFDYVRSYATEFYGKQFLIKLPFLCGRSEDDTPWVHQDNWTNAASGWSEWPVLGLPNPGWALNQFRSDDGKIKCFVKFVDERPMDLGKLNKEAYFSTDPYTVYVAATSEEIVWVTPTDARAVVVLSGPISQLNKNGDKETPHWILGRALYNKVSEKAADGFVEILQSMGHDRLAMGMKEAYVWPVGAAVPLQSRRLVYGPWFARNIDNPGFDLLEDVSLLETNDRGKTFYERDSGFAPWLFGDWDTMDRIAHSTVTSMLGDYYVVESGMLSTFGSPVGSLGDALLGSGPLVSQIDVQVGRGDGGVLTTYNIKNQTPDMGKLAKQRIDQIRRANQKAIKIEKYWQRENLKKLRDTMDLDNRRRKHMDEGQLPSAGMTGMSSHDMLGGQAGQDIDGPDLVTDTIQDAQHYIAKHNAIKNVQSPIDYEQSNQDLEPHASTAVVMSEPRKDMRGLRADSGHRWRRRAYMDSIGMFRPYSTLPHAHKADQDDSYFIPHWRNEINKDKVLSDDGVSYDGQSKLTAVGGSPTTDGDYMTNNVDYFSHEQVPPIFCKEQHLPINITTLSPFLQKGRSLMPGTVGWGNGGLAMTKSPDTSKGHDIEYVARDGVYPAHLSVRHPQDNYSQAHWYRAVALKGPLVLAGWGNDIDNKPVPNASTTYPSNPKMEFEQDWLRKPQKWMCGPVDLRWDYKRQVWTAPSTMKIVKLQLMEHLCVGESANAILYNDQEQYDYNGQPVDLTESCGKKGYKVKVYSNAMYPVPKGWRIMAHFDTTHNRYQMINHDPLPIVEADLDGDMLCGDGTATIVGPAGDCSDNLDPCNALTGMTVSLTNTLNQPLCAPRKVFVWICGFECSASLGDPGPTLTDCSLRSSQPLTAKGIILQAEFKPQCIVTHLELMEFYAWGYDVSCDEEDITIYPQGDVETAWDWCLQLDGIACLPSYSGVTVSDTHTHTAAFSGTISGTVGSGYTSEDTHGHNAVTTGTIASGTTTGVTDAASHTHSVPFDHTVSGEISIDIPSGTVSGEGTVEMGGRRIFTGIGTGSGTGILPSSVCDTDITGAGFALGPVGGHTAVTLSDTIVISATTSSNTDDFVWVGTPTVSSCNVDIIGSGIVDGTLNITDCSVDCGEGEVTGTWSGTVPSQALVDGVTDSDMHSHTVSFSHNVSGTTSVDFPLTNIIGAGTVSSSGSRPFDGAGTGDGFGVLASSVCETTLSGTGDATGDVTGNTTVTLTDTIIISDTTSTKTDTFNWNGIPTVSSCNVDIIGSGIVDGTLNITDCSVACGSGVVSGTWSGVVPSQALVGGVTDSDTHSHVATGSGATIEFDVVIPSYSWVLTGETEEDGGGAIINIPGSGGLTTSITGDHTHPGGDGGLAGAHSHTIGGSTSAPLPNHSHTFASQVIWTQSATIPIDADVDDINMNIATDTHSHAVTGYTASSVLSGVLLGSVNLSGCTCSVSGNVDIDATDIADALDTTCTVLLDSLSVSGTTGGHYHSIYDTYNFNETGNFPLASGVATTPIADIASGISATTTCPSAPINTWVTTVVTGTLTSHTHGFTDTFQAPAQTLSGTFEDTVSGTLYTNSDTHSHAVTGYTASSVLSGVLIGSVDLSGCTCSVSGNVDIDATDITGALDTDCTVLMDSLSVSGTTSGHTHTVYDEYDFNESGNFPLVSGIAIMQGTEIASTLTATTTCPSAAITTNVETIVIGELTSHVHDFTDTFYVESQTVSGTYSGSNISGSLTTDSDEHSHITGGTYPSQAFTALTIVDIDTHSHTVEIALSGTVSGTIEGISEDTHGHDFTIPDQEVNLCLDTNFDLDIDSRFVASPCTIRIAVVNKNFWEYYWYALCICTQAIWHEAELGPVACDFNTMPTCDTDCANIECGSAPVLDCGSLPTRTEYSFVDGEDVSWFDTATDTTLINTQTTCTDNTPAAPTASATCGSLVIPSLASCLADSGCGEVSVTDSGVNTPATFTDDPDTLDGYCPAFTTLTFVEDAWLRDVANGTFDMISDDAADHLPDFYTGYYPIPTY